MGIDWVDVRNMSKGIKSTLNKVIERDKVVVIEASLYD